MMTPRFQTVLAAFLWTLSFFLSIGFLAPPEPERLASVLAGLTGLGVLAAAGGDLHRRELPAPRVALFIVLFWVLVVASAAWSVAPSATLAYAGSLTLMPATVLAVLFARADLRVLFLQTAAWGAGAVVMGVSLWAVAQVFIFPEYLSGGQVRHPFANPNAFAALLGLSVMASLGLFLTVRDRRVRVALWVMLLAALCAFAAIAGKAATLALSIGIVVLLPLVGRRGLAGSGRALAALAVAVAVVGVVMALRPDKTDPISVVWAMLGGEIPTILNRIDIWRATLDLVAAHPWLGTGYKTFQLMYPSVRPDGDIYSGGFMVHSDPLQFWAELGILGPVLFYAAGGLVFWRAMTYLCGPAGRDLPRQYLVLALLLGCGAFIAHSHVDFPLYTLATMMAFALALSALVTITADPDKDTAQPLSFTAHWPAGLRVAALALPVLGFLAVHVPAMLGDYHASRAARLIRAGDMDGFAAAVNTANRIGLGWNARPYAMAATVPLGLLKARAPLLPPPEQQALFAQTESLLAKALARNSRMAAAWYHRGDMLGYVDPDIVPEGYGDAGTLFARALALDPLHLPSRMALATVYERAGQPDRALDLLLAGVHWPYPAFDATPFYDRTLALATTLGRGDEAARIERFRILQDTRVAGAARWQAALERRRDGSPFLP